MIYLDLLEGFGDYFLTDVQTRDGLLYKYVI